jgi:hypothetical protein
VRTPYWKLVLVCLEIVLILTQYMCTVCARKYHRLKNRYGRTRRNTSVKWVLLNLISIYLETVLVSMQVMCTVCTKRTIGPKIIFDTLMVLLVYKAQLHFGPFGDSANLEAR